MHTHFNGAGEPRQVELLAYYDTLTGLPNRRLLLDRLNHALTQARRFGRSMAVMFLDPDHFKQINDAFGHSAGDEFIIVLTEVSHPLDAARVAEKIIDAFSTPVAMEGQRVPVTISIGIALYPVNGSDAVEELMIKADMAMYEAKQAGRNTYRFFQPVP